jgi:hypothetical protein
MAYIPPSMVKSPQRSVEDLQVLYDGKEYNEEDENAGWSAALMTWEGNPNCLGIRWNGSDGHIGNPQSREVPTWFIIPDPLKDGILQKIKEIAK